MLIARADSWRRTVPLKRPYTITGATVEAVELFFVRLTSDSGTIGLGSASPGERVTGEEVADTAAALADLDWLAGHDLRHLGVLAREAAAGLAATPAARAAVDMALHDLFARNLGIPLVDLLGRRRHRHLPTSVTLGISSVEETLELADEYLAAGFRCLKVKVGLDPEADFERLDRLRRHVGPDVLLRIDANQGYDFETTRQLGGWIERFDLELVEQPLPSTESLRLHELEPALRRRLAADECLVSERDALVLAGGEPLVGIWNVKLMKCGGVAPARTIAELADMAGVELMWGSMDESRISIAAALATALASESTRYLDLDGSFDLARDPAVGGFTLDHGFLRPLPVPGLGVELREEPS